MTCSLLILMGCATTVLPPENSPAIPLEKANLELVLNEQEGMEITREDAKDLRDFYRGGVQKKAEGERQLQEKNYPQALKMYESSNEFFRAVLQYNDQDNVECPLFEGTSILFFPNLLMADNHLKMGRIFQGMGRESPARRKWKQALPFLEQSLRTEPTEWGFSLQRELVSLLGSKSR